MGSYILNGALKGLHLFLREEIIPIHQLWLWRRERFCAAFIIILFTQQTCLQTSSSIGPVSSWGYRNIPAQPLLPGVWHLLDMGRSEMGTRAFTSHICLMGTDRTKGLRVGASSQWRRGPGEGHWAGERGVPWLLLPRPLKAGPLLERNPTAFSPSTPGMSLAQHDRIFLLFFNRMVCLACLLCIKWQQVCMNPAKRTMWCSTVALWLYAILDTWVFPPKNKEQLKIYFVYLFINICAKEYESVMESEK